MRFAIIQILVIILLATSCSVSKRHYRPGFFIQHRSEFNSKHISTFCEVDSVLSRPETFSKKVINEDAKNFCEVKLAKDSFLLSSSIVLISSKSNNIFYKNSNIYFAKNLHPNINSQFIKVGLKKKEELTIAQYYANRSVKNIIFSIIFCWYVFAGIIFALLAIHNGKMALLFNQEHDIEIDKRANLSIKIGNFILTIYSILFILGVVLLILLI